MLVAPLMSPLIAFSVGMTTGRIRLIRRSLLSVVQGFVLAFILALLIGIISPSSLVTAEMAGRGNPTVLDMGVALASGIIGAYATARKDIPAALAGVAIAAALMPPVCTIALALAYEDLSLARGAALLFTTNIVSIILAAWAVFFWLGLRPRMVQESRVRQFTSAALVVVFAAIISVFMLRDVNPRRFQADIEAELQAAFQQDQLLSFEVRRNDPLEVVAVVRRAANRLNDNREVVAARAQLQARLHQPVELQVVIEPFFNADLVVTRQVLSEQIRQVFDVELQGDTVVLAVAETAIPSITSRQTEIETALSLALGRPVTLEVRAR
jgi:uncharacterized hydrophobic protein (TIGR00271 family)